MQKLSKDLTAGLIKGPFVPAPHADSVLQDQVSGSNAMLVETHPRQAGVRASRAFYNTPWDSTGLDGGSAESLSTRYSADLAELQTKIGKLRAA